MFSCIIIFGMLCAYIHTKNLIFPFTTLLVWNQQNKKQFKHQLHSAPYIICCADAYTDTHTQDILDVKKKIFARTTYANVHVYCEKCCVMQHYVCVSYTFPVSSIMHCTNIKQQQKYGSNFLFLLLALCLFWLRLCTARFTILISNNFWYACYGYLDTS